MDGKLSESTISTYQDLDKVSSDFGNLLTTGILSDVTLVVGPHAVRKPAHRLILSTRSDYFRAMFYNGMKETNADEIILADWDPVGTDLLLSYLYTGKIEFNLTTAVHVLPLLHQLCEKKALDYVLTRVFDYVDTSNVSMHLRLASNYASEAFRRSMEDIFLDHLPQIPRDENLFLLSQSHMLSLVQREDVIFNEKDLLKLLVDWSAGRQQVPCADILMHVRVCYMTLADIFTAVEPSGFFSAELLLKFIKYINFPDETPCDIMNLRPRLHSHALACRALQHPDLRVIPVDVGTVNIERRDSNRTNSEYATVLGRLLPNVGVLEWEVTVTSTTNSSNSSYPRVLLGLASEDCGFGDIYTHSSAHLLYTCTGTLWSDGKSSPYSPAFTNLNRGSLRPAISMARYEDKAVVRMVSLDGC
eukprot:Colp12_sorted_trinity150504_noHs@30767